MFSGKQTLNRDLPEGSLLKIHTCKGVRQTELDREGIKLRSSYNRGLSPFYQELQNGCPFQDIPHPAKGTGPLYTNSDPETQL